MTLATASWLLAVQTFFTTLLTVFAVKRVCLSVGCVDIPNDRKIHDKPIVTLGGVGIFLGLLASFLLLFLWSGDAVTKRWNTYTFVVTYKEYAHLCLLFVTSTIIVAIGLWDDLRDCGPWMKIFFQIVAAGTFVGLRITSWSGDLQFNFETMPPGVFLFRFILFTAWIVLLLNAINLVDGLDGLAAGMVGIASFWLLMANRPMENHFITWTSAMLMGACLAFLVFNFHPASIFMGDAGSLLLGLWVAAGSIEGDFKKISGMILATPIILLGIPLLEVFSSALRRWWGGTGIFQADSKHMHHRLLKLGFRHRNIVLFYYGMTFLLGMLGFLLAPSRFIDGEPVPRIADPEMVYWMLLVIGGGVLMGYLALVSIEKRFEEVIREIAEEYERGRDVREGLHELVAEEGSED